MPVLGARAGRGAMLSYQVQVHQYQILNDRFGTWNLLVAYEQASEQYKCKRKNQIVFFSNLILSYRYEVVYNKMSSSLTDPQAIIKANVRSLHLFWLYN